MRALVSGTITWLMVAAIGLGCGGGDGGSGPASGVLTTLEVTPATATLFTIPPANSIMLGVVAKDQEGRTMSGLGPPTFSSDNPAVTSVAEDGRITAVGAGTAVVTATLTTDGVTKSDNIAVAVKVAPTGAGVGAPAFQFEPATVDISSGGTVTWSFGAIHHTVTFSVPGSPESIPELENGSAARTFPTNGTFPYHCSLHQGMTGIVRVH